MFIDFAKLSDCVNDEVLAHLCYQCNKCGRFDKDKQEKKVVCKQCGEVNYYIKKKGHCIECYNYLERNDTNE